MAFSGLSTNKLFTPNLLAEDVSEIFRTLVPYEAPFLDWLGDPSGFAGIGGASDGFIQDFLAAHTESGLSRGGSAVLRN